MYSRLQSSTVKAELERFLGELLAADYEIHRGQARRYPARRLALRLRQQGFLPTQHFLDRFHEGVHAIGARFNPKLFGSDFYRARHYRQTRPGYNTRIAIMSGIPVVYRMGGENANRVVLVDVLPEGALPSVVPARPPRLREGEALNRLLRYRRQTGRDRRLVVGRGRNSSRSLLRDVGRPQTMDRSRATNPHYLTSLEDALRNFPGLRGQFSDVLLERMGINPHASPGTLSIGVTPMGMQVARELLQPGGALRILQNIPSGQHPHTVAQIIQDMLPAGATNVRVIYPLLNGLRHVLVVARY
ncbi:MAG: hypothetical protein MI924_01680 [Chloroflexales bacterium]|nr:hypothetical protein [Chloroflexales bacterium]